MGQILFDAFAFGYLAFFAVILFLRPTADLVAADLTKWGGLFLGLSVLGCAVALVFRRKRTLGALIYARRRLETSTPFFRTWWGIELAALLIVTFMLGVWLTEISLIRLIEAESFSQAIRLFSELAHPNWSILPRAVVKIIESVYIAFMATALAFPIAFVLSFLSARNLMSGSKTSYFVYSVLRIFFNFVRSVEPVLWAILFSIWVSFGPFAGMLALMVHSVASLAKQYSEIVEGVEEGPIEGIEATGAGKLQTVWFAVVPQVVLPFISFTIYRWDTNLRMATILGFVGGGGIGAMLMEYQGQARWAEVGTIILVIAVVVWILDAFSAHVRAAVR